VDDLLKAFKEEDSKGRRYKEARIKKSPFFRDFLRIIESKAYRRLDKKTQAFSLPDHPYIRTRASHTNEVLATTARISEALGLNTELCLAIAAGHDIGHAPFGHVGERMLTKIGQKRIEKEKLTEEDKGKKIFDHATYGVVIAQEIENRGDGLNLNYEVLEGMLMHSRGAGELYLDLSKPAEYSALTLADKISYVCGDYSDANRCGHFPKQDYPELVEKINKYLGNETKERRYACIAALTEESKKKGHISFSEGPVYETFEELRGKLYQEVYKKINVKMHEDTIYELYKFLSQNKEFRKDYNGFDPLMFISLLTDQEVTQYGHLLFKSKNIELKDIQNFGAFEQMPELINKKIEYWNPGLDW